MFEQQARLGCGKFSFRMTFPISRVLVAAGLLSAVSVLSACSSVYYGAMEEIGVHKRDILVKRVDKAKDAQEETKQEFASALEQFQSVVNFHGGDLQREYERLNSAYERSEAKAKAVKTRNDDVENVAKALFREWRVELGEYTNANLRASSAQQLAETESRFRQLMQVMRRAESRMEPVLRTFRDQVLYLKHNLNARAIGALRVELASVEANTAALIREMNVSIAEAQRFIASME